MTIVLRTASAKEIHLLYAQLPEFDVRHSLLDIEMQLHNHSHRLLLAEVDGCPVGFVSGYALSDTLFHCWLGGVLPGFRRRGLARLLWAELEQWARMQGYRKISVNTRNRFQRMLLFLITNHYQLTRLDVRDNEEENLIWLTKSL